MRQPILLKMDDISEFRLVQRKRRLGSTIHKIKEPYKPQNADQHEETASAALAVASVSKKIDEIRLDNDDFNRLCLDILLSVVNKYICSVDPGCRECFKVLAFTDHCHLNSVHSLRSPHVTYIKDKVSFAVQNIYRNQTNHDKSFRETGKRIHTNSESIPQECELQEEVDGSSVNKERHITAEYLESGTISQLVCYGLGNFAECYIARYQLALLEALRIKFEVPPERALIYDPKFCNVEKMVLEKLGYTVIRNNEEGKREFACEGVSLVFMPHCGRGLYNNLLWSNWSPRLQNLIIIGNSFARIVLSTPKRFLLTAGNFILKLQPYTTEEDLPVNSKFSDVFNDTVIHIFFQNSCPDADEGFWDRGPEPVYDDEDAEMILNK